MAVLFSAFELADHLRKPVDDEAAASVERVVWGWLKPVLGLTTRPSPVPEEVYSWAIELGAIAYENPSGMSAATIGPFRYEFSAERRLEILAEAAGRPAGVALAPVASFPDAPGWEPWR